MKQDVQIRTMTVSDIPTVCQVWKKSGLAISDYDREQYELVMVLTMNPQTCLVASVGKSTVGTIIGAFNGRRAWIYHLAVLPEWQSQGVGSLLLSTVEATAKHLGATRILLGVGWSNMKVVPFYTKSGYSAMMDMFIMQKNLYRGENAMPKPAFA